MVAIEPIHHSPTHYSLLTTHHSPLTDTRPPPMTPLASTLEVHDFRQPRQLMPASWRTLQRWYADGCRLVAERWGKLGLDVTLSHQKTRVLSVRNALTAVPEPGWGVRGTVGATSIDTLLACSPRQLQSLVSRLLGDAPDETSEVTSLTAVEESMAELLFTEFMHALGEAWPGAESLSCRLVDAFAQPQRTRMYPPRTTLVVTTFRIVSTSTEGDESIGGDSSEEMIGGESSANDVGSPPDLGRGELVWIMPQVDIEDLIEIECESPAPQPTKPHPAISRLMRDMPVSITVELGRIHLSMSELTSLEPGDVVILEQSVHRPLNVRVGDAVKFRGRPGRLGAHRCLEIEHVLEDVPAAPPVSLPN